MRLLLLHPLPLDGSIFSDDIRALADASVAPTLYGAGDDLTSWAEAALDAVGDGPVVVVGNSIGGSCAIEVARLAPTKVKALVLCGTKPAHRPEPERRDAALRILAGDGLAAAWDRYWLPLFGPNASDDVIEHAWQIASVHGPDLIAAGVRAFHGRSDGEAFLHSWMGAVWMVSGEHDIDPHRSRSLADRLPHASFHLVEGVGHYLPLEAPGALTSLVSQAVAAAR
jgi:pimeloyl-ACP methyl ester carboxylesterase